MKVLLQTVKDASVTVDGKTIGAIDDGILLLVGFKEGDDESAIKPHVDKVLDLRIFCDENDKMNLSLREVKKDILIVSQFTLYADVSKGRRPSFIKALKPEFAKEYFLKFVEECRRSYPEGKVETGRFGAMMQVQSTNQGPTTIIVELN